MLGDIVRRKLGYAAMRRPSGHPAIPFLCGALALVATAIGVAACSSGTRDKDKTTTAAAGAGTTAVVVSTATTGSVTAAASPTVSIPTTVKIASGSPLGRILTDDKGMTLYIFKNDVA